MNINNKTNCKDFDEYIQIFKCIIEQSYPILIDHTIEIYLDKYNNYDPPCTEPMVSIAMKEVTDLPFDLVIVKPDYMDKLGNSLYNRFTKEELFALLSHEIGHLAAYYNNQACKGVAEEIIADKCAYDLGLGVSMIEAIKKMKDDCNDSPSSYFNSMPGLNKYSTGEMDKRIVELEKLTNITDATS